MNCRRKSLAARTARLLTRFRPRLARPHRYAMPRADQVLCATLRNNRLFPHSSRRIGIAAKPQKCWAFLLQRFIEGCAITIWKDVCADACFPLPLGGQ